MSFLNNLKIGTKLRLLIIASSIGLVAFAAYSFYTLSVVRINGTVYQDITTGKDLIADILPPPAYIIQSHLVAIQVMEEADHNDKDVIAALLEQASALQAEYETSHAYWVKALATNPDKDVNQAFLEDSYQAAETYYQVFNEQFIPAIQSRQLDRADKILHENLTGLFEEHRTAIEKVATMQAAVLKQKETAAQSLVNRSITLLIILSILSIGMVIGLGFLIARSISDPVAQLTQVATQIAKGNFDIPISGHTKDEIGTLSDAFRSMTSQLREMISSLESRVTERTQGLELAAQVGRSVSQVRALDVMLKDAVDIIRSQFDLYYVQVYLADSSFTNLILKSGTGEVGAQLAERSHSLPLNSNSINGRAALEKRSVIVADIATSLIFHPNELLPLTRSEMAVPLMVNEKVVGVLDIQSATAGALNKDLLPAFEALAGQLAIAIQNANLLAETEQARVEVEKQARRLARIGWQEYLDAIHKPEQTSFVFTGDQVAQIGGDQLVEWPAEQPPLTAPIAVSGEPLGTLAVGLDPERQTPQTIELVNIVARQVAQQIENLRLLESAERYRLEAEQAIRRLSHEGWETYLGSRSKDKFSYWYDTNEVKPYQPEQAPEQLQEQATNIPLKLRDETVGQISILGLDSKDAEALNLTSAVAERLSAHIESLRLSQQTEQTAQREQILRQITSAVRSTTDPTSILRTAVRELGTILGRKTIIRMKTENEIPGSQTSALTEPEVNTATSNESESAPSVESPNAVGGDE